MKYEYIFPILISVDNVCFIFLRFRRDRMRFKHDIRYNVWQKHNRSYLVTDV